ncbi:unnamed protein product [Symbiodinium natans]|uniref:Uncharacterized protein n=1 Tax=Symbiodinium natans TaxID=878477 RepID=A0A812QJS0_9DINO|nr:unnamed protein product [Symbiodinium natans]
MQRFVKHSDVQALLPDLGLPLIDFAAVPSSGATVVIDDDDTPNPGVSLVAMEGEGTSAPSHIPSPSPAPHELSQLRAHDVWAASRSTQSSSLTVLDIDEDETEHEHADNHVGEQIVPVQAAADQTQLAVRNVGWGGSRLTLQKLKDLKHDDFANMTAARCAIVGAQACASLRRMSEQLAVAKLAKRRLNRKLSVSASRATKQQSLQDAKSSNESTLVLQTGRSGKRLTPTATLALGIRRNIAHVAAADFGALLMVDLSGSTVIRSEIRTGAALAASMQDYTSDLMSVLRSTGRATVPGVDAPDLADIAYDESAWSLLVISVRADATHSSIWRREKLHVTEAELGLVTASLKSFPVSTDASDLQIVSGCTAEHAAGILQKQLNSIGVPSVSDIVAELTAASVEDVDRIVYIPSDCYLHIFHAAVRGGLELVDELIAEAFSSETLRGFDRYYSSIAKLTNLWREKASAMMTAWQDVHDGQGEASEDTRLLGQRYPLSVSSGRWGSVEGAEEFLLERGRPLVEPVMLRVLSKFMKADTDTAADAVDAENVDAAAADPASAEAAPAAGDGGDSGLVKESDGMDDVASYKIKLTKWCTGTLRAVTSCVFWCLLFLCRTLRSPLRHFMLFVQKESRGGECMFKLITSKLGQITREFQTLFHRLPEIVSQAMHLSGCLDDQKGLSDRDVLHMRYVALRLLLMHWAAFRRRIIRPLQQFPWQLFWLIKDPPRQFSQKRKDIATKFLMVGLEDLDHSSRKIRALCSRELQHMRDHGVFPDVPSVSGSFMYGFLKSLARMQPVDTQAIEGINSVIKLVGRRCPNISLELLSARLAIKRSLTEDGSMRRQKKWSRIRHAAEQMLATITGYHGAALAILGNPSRWSHPLPVELVCLHRCPWFQRLTRKTIKTRRAWPQRATATRLMVCQ